jgi:deoxyhypusine monooxygenase
MENDMRHVKYEECLLDLSQPVAKRTHAAFHLRTLGTELANQSITKAVVNREDSSLMRHELAYILGQMQMTQCCPTLSGILENEDEDVLVRHESAESLGAIGNVDFLPVLEKFREHSAPEIAETCQIAVDLIKYRHEQNGGKVEGQGEFMSVDPAPALKKDDGTPLNAEELEKAMMNTDSPLFVRYRAMFSLRNLNSDDAALALCRGFDDSSALFRHEVAYVLGQVMRRNTVPALSKVLENLDEHRMVRHEAAEALGAIGGSDVEELLTKYRSDPEAVINESCMVALDTIDYWNEFKGGEGEGEGEGEAAAAEPAA